MHGGVSLKAQVGLSLWKSIQVWLLIESMKYPLDVPGDETLFLAFHYWCACQNWNSCAPHHTGKLDMNETTARTGHNGVLVLLMVFQQGHHQPHKMMRIHGTQSSLKKHKTADLFLLEICVVILSNWACKAVEAVSMLHLLHAWQGTIWSHSYQPLSFVHWHLCTHSPSHVAMMLLIPHTLPRDKKWHETLENLCLVKYVANYNIKSL